MRLETGRWIIAAGLAAFAILGAGAAHATPTQEQETVRVSSLAGAYLAARIAETDDQLGAAVAYYERALSFDPDNQTLQQSLLLGLISQGEFDQALPFAEKLKEVPEVERFSRLALGVDAIRKGEYSDAQHWLKLALESDLDRLITGLMSAWAKLGAGEGGDAVTSVDNLAGPEWYNLFLGYHKALIAEQAGDIETARAAFEATVGNVSAGGAAPDAFLRSMEAYAGFLARQGDSEAALELLGTAEEFATGRVT